MSSKKYYYQDNRNGFRFWDSYLHNRCDLVEVKEFQAGTSPFDKKETVKGEQNA